MPKGVYKRINDNFPKTYTQCPICLDIFYSKGNKCCSIECSIESRRRNYPSFRKRPIFTEEQRIKRLSQQRNMVFVEELGHCVRSKSLEKVGLLYFKRNNISYTYEPQWFKLKSDLINGYLPDIHMVGTNIWLEFKGPRKTEIIDGIKINQIDDRSKEKMKQFRIQYPQNKLWVVTYKEMLERFPKECYDNIFKISDLQKCLDALKRVA